MRCCAIKAAVREGDARELQGDETAPHLHRVGRGEHDNSAGELCGADNRFDLQTFRTPIEGEQRQSLLIVSPEDGERLDAKELACGHVPEEKDTGRSWIWKA